MRKSAGDRSTGSRSRWMALLTCALLAAACSSIKLGYNNADTLLVYALDNYFDLDEAQANLARERVRALHAWHREKELPGYSRLLQNAQDRLSGAAAVTADDVLAFQRDMNERLARLGNESAPDLAALAQTLTPAQLERFADKLARDNSKARRELVQIAGRETPADREKRYVERVEQWFGSVSAEQREIIRADIGARPPARDWWMDERERRQRELTAVLLRIRAEQPAREVATVWLREYFGQLVEPRDAGRLEKLQQFRVSNAALIAQLINAATPPQKSTLVKKLRGYAEDFAALANGGLKNRG